MISFFKQYKSLIIISSFSLFIWCCKATQSLAPVDTDVANAQAKWKGTTLGQLTRGYDIYNDKCTQCHEQKKPQDFSVDDWNKILPGMGRKARLDSDQYTLVYHYILAKRETVLAGNK